jgi:uncharacterized protein YebE (UPF0316 family)
MTSFIDFIDADVFNWVIVPLLIMCARIFDVSLGTIRIILIGKGYKNVAPIVGFFEILIWIIAVSQIMQHLDRWLYYIAYATGYALGTLIGMKLENKLSLGQVVVRIITASDSNALIDCLKEHNYNFTTVEAMGKFGPVKIIFTITQRHLLNKTIKLIEEHNPASFYSVEDVRYVKGSLPGGKNPIINTLKNPFTKNAILNSAKRK